MTARAAEPRTADAGPPSRALRHYNRAIQAIAGATYDGLSGAERRALLAALCREKQRLVNEAADAP
ncbi:MAG: hypothetical protein V5A22_14405 [Salinivenus sp.]